MAVRIFNKGNTYRLETTDNPPKYMTLKPFSFIDVPEEFTGDITFKTAVKAGTIEVFETKKQGEAIEKAVYEPKPKKAKAAKGDA